MLKEQTFQLAPRSIPTIMKQSERKAMNVDEIINGLRPKRSTRNTGTSVKGILSRPETKAARQHDFIKNEEGPTDDERGEGGTVVTPSRHVVENESAECSQAAGSCEHVRDLQRRPSRVNLSE